MQAGTFDRRVTILQPAGGRDAFSSIDGAFSEAGVRWAAKLDVSDRERIAARQQGGDVTTRWRMRSDALTRTITTAFRLRHHGVDYEISGIKELGRSEGIEVTSARRDDGGA